MYYNFKKRETGEERGGSDAGKCGKKEDGGISFQGFALAKVGSGLKVGSAGFR
jgi:hypothetical protein